MSGTFREKISNIFGWLSTSARVSWHITRWVVIFVAVAVLAANVLGWALYSRGYFHNLIESEGERFLSGFTEVEVVIGDVSGNLWSGITLNDIIIGNGPSIEDDGIAIRAEELRVHYNPLKLLTGKIVIDRVYLEGGEVNLLRDPDGTINLARIFDDEDDGPSDPNFYLELSHIELNDVDYYMDVGSPLHDFTDIHIETALTVVGSTVFLDIGDCSCYLPEYNQWLPSFGNGGMTINSRRVMFRKVKVESPTTNIICSGEIKNNDDGPTELDLEFAIEPMDIGECLSGVMDIPPDIYGAGRYRGRLYGADNALIQEGRLEISDGYAFGFPVNDFNAEYAFDISNETLSVEEAQGRIANTFAQAYGTVYLPAGGVPSYSIEAYLENVDVGSFIGNEDLASDVDAIVSVYGTGIDEGATIALSAEVGPGRFGPAQIDGALVEMNVAGDNLFFDRVDIAIGEGTAAFTGGFSSSDLELAIAAEDIPLDRLSFPGLDEELSGALSCEGYVYGNPAYPSFDGEIVGSGIRISDIYMDSVRAEGIWDELGSENNANARIFFWDADVFGIPIATGTADIAASDEYIAIDRGRFEFSPGRYIHFAALLNTEEKNFTLTDGGYVFPGGEIALADTWTAEFAGERVVFGGANAVYGSAYINLSGWVEPRNGLFDADLVCGEMPIGDLWPVSGDFYYDGTVRRLDIHGEGKLESPSVTAGLLLEDIYLNDEHLESVETKAVLENDTVTVHRLDVISAGGALYAAGVFPAGILGGSTEGAVDINVAASDFDIGIVNAFSDTDVFDGGTVSGAVVLYGPVKSPAVDLELYFAGLEKDAVRFDNAIVDINYSDGLATISDISLSNNGKTMLDIYGEAAFDLNHVMLHDELADGPLNVNITLDGLELSVANLASDEFLITGGGLYGGFDLTGSIHEPVLDGAGEVRNCTGIIRFLRSEVSNLNGDFTVDNNVLVVKDDNPMTCKIDGGDAFFSGVLNTDGLIPTDLNVRLTAQDYLVKIIPGMHAKGDIEIYRLSGPLDSPYIEGKFTVKSGLVTIPFTTNDSATYGEPVGDDGIDYKFTVVTDGEIWLRNASADILLDVDMEVSSKNGELQLTGEMNSIRGTYYFLQRDFFIDEAEIIFTGDSGLNPTLDIIGHNYIRGEDEYGDPEIITMEIGVTGKTDDINIRLSCSDYPYLEQKDLMIMLAMNITWAEYQNMSKGDIAAQESKDFVRRMAEKELARLLRRGTGLDYLHFETTSREEETEVEVKVGHFITGNLFVAYTGKYEDKPGAYEMEHAFEAEYQLIKRFYLVGETFHEEGEQRFGSSIKYKMKY